MAYAAQSIRRGPLTLAATGPPHCETEQRDKQCAAGNVEQIPNHALIIARWGRLLNIMFGTTTLIALVCIGAGGALARMTWWFWTEARPESPALAPLEIMSDAAYGKADETQRVAMLDAVRVSADRNPVAKPIRNEARKPVGRPERAVEAPAGDAPRHVIDPLLK